MATAARRARAWLAVAALALGAAAAQAAEVGDAIRLPDITLLDGSTVPASHWAGKPVVVEFWATWCPFCALQNPRLQALYDKTRGTKLQVLTISIDRDPREAQTYVKQRGYTFPATMDSDALRRAFGTRRGLPELYVLDGKGRVVQKEVGEMIDDDVAALARYAKP
ncbi:TlpA disulfide reductase family protein [Cupriavidus agavae]|uniref:Thiol-disulfide isomerase/thioredoxin n=1 Tax=Cupriavidus agavae TaxID=1001822 RepID=A0A4Q7RDC7_9BURK|nr:TlpA disulfide reductase family protein [Cupriavidus agavae]RZT29642.1 thiol-disulfide isomerase/thioredoxin [Cupriavidus agavae]